MKKCALLILAMAVNAIGAEPELKISVLDNAVLCVRASRLPADVKERIHEATSTNRLAGSVGTVLDLRFADVAASNAADYFLQRATPLIILVNSQTRGTAAALARTLRSQTSAILIGSTNAPTDLTPDIAVPVGADTEKKFQDDPYVRSSGGMLDNLSATNELLAFVDHTSEAELVRKRVKDGEDDGDTASPRAEPPQPVIQDPELARAVDLLKALAALHGTRG